MNDKKCSNPSCLKSLENNNAIYQCQRCDKYCCSNSCLKEHKLTEHPIQFPKKTNIHFSKYYDKSYDISNNKRNTNENQLSILKSPFIKEGEIITKFTDTQNYEIKNFQFVRNPNNNKIISCGKGKFAKILLAKNINNNKLYAIKHIIKENIIEQNYNIDIVNNEIKIHQSLIHPNIIRLYSYFEDEKNYLIVLEYAKESLYSKMKKIGKLKEDEAFNIFIQITSALYFLHSNNYIHRDIKPENILINENNEIKLCDFGWCTKINKKIKTIIKNNKIEYISPEMIREQPYDQSIDIWSLGILLYELLHGYTPFAGIENNKPGQIMKNIIIDKYIIDDKLNLTNECIDLINKLLEFDSEKRIKVQQIFIHPWVLKYANKDKNKISNIDLMENINVFNTGFKKNEILNKIENDNKILFEIKHEDNILNEHLNTDSNDLKNNIFEKAIKKSHKRKKKTLRSESSLKNRKKIEEIENYGFKRIDSKNRDENSAPKLINGNSKEFNVNNKINNNIERIENEIINKKKDKNKNCYNDILINDNNNININNINIYNSLQIDRAKTQYNPNLYLKSGNFYLGYDTPGYDIPLNNIKNDLNYRNNLNDDAIAILENANLKKKEQKKQNKKVILRNPPGFWDKLFEHFKCGFSNNDNDK